MLDNLAEQLANVHPAEGTEPLPDDAIHSLAAELRARADEIAAGDRTPDVVTELAEIADGVEQCGQELDRRNTERTALNEQADAALARINPPEQSEGEQPAEGQPPAEQAPTEVPVAAPNTPADPTAAAPQAAPAASQTAAVRRPTAAAMTAHRPTTMTPQARADTALTGRARMYATLGGAGANPGDEITEDQLAQIIADRHHRMGQGQVTVASMRTELPESRHVRIANSAAANTAVFDAALALPALVASGGICAPVAVDYTVPTFGATVRPIRDALPRFAADRGGIRFITPPALTDSAGAVGIWTEAQDASVTFTSGGVPSATKALYVITCGTEEVVFVDAVTARTRVGNMQQRFGPEFVKAVLSNVAVNTARTAELNLLTKISAASTAVSASQLLGATRDLLATVDQATAAYRYTYRIPEAQALRVILPEFAKAMIRADLTRELAHDNSGQYNALAVTDAQVQSWFVARGLNLTFTVDAFPASAGNAFQGFAAQASGLLVPWPTNVVWWMFAEGSFQFLDGGLLDLGIIRDSILDSTNDLEMFSESFEGVAFRGVKSYQVTSTVAPNGTSTAGIAHA